MEDENNSRFKDDQGNVIIECCECCTYSRFLEHDVRCCKKPPCLEGFPIVNRKDWCGEWEFCEDKND